MYSNWFKLPKKRFFLFTIIILLLTITINWLWLTYSRLNLAKSYPVEAFWVLGGSINREIYVTKLRQQNPTIPILISQGSQEPCVVLIFQRAKIHLDNVWLEKCGLDTFGNFYFGIPLLRQWGIHKVKLITSQSHLPRAKLMAQIISSFNGIALELEIVPEQGVPGNREFPLKTFLDVTRIVLWSPFSQIIFPQCNRVVQLSEVDLNYWLKKGFGCESQAHLKIPKF
jgi:hypothetical protein